MIKVNLSPLLAFKSAVESMPLWHRISKIWAARYRGFIQERFDTYSKGGGDWAPLAPSTIKARRKGRGKGSPAILKNTGILFAAINPTFSGQPGALQEDIPFGVRVGYGGEARYPGASPAIADIAAFHQAGGRHLPKREIIVDPPITVTEAMAQDAERIIKNAIR